MRTNPTKKVDSSQKKTGFTPAVLAAPSNPANTGGFSGVFGSNSASSNCNITLSFAHPSHAAAFLPASGILNTTSQAFPTKL
jgi:hypothetical protein